MLYILIIGLLLQNSLANAAEHIGEEKYRWKNRVIYLNGTETSKFSEQVKVFKAKQAENTERQLLLVEVSDEKSNQWKKLSFRKGRFQLSLVGKDGYEKKTYFDVTTMEEIYKVIDAMPMRQSEMKRRSGQKK